MRDKSLINSTCGSIYDSVFISVDSLVHLTSRKSVSGATYSYVTTHVWDVVWLCLDLSLAAAIDQSIAYTANNILRLPK